MAYKDKDMKIGGTYRHSIFVRQTVKGSPRSLYDYLQGAFTNPAALRLALRLMRVRNPDREYVTDDPAIS